MARGESYTSEFVASRATSWGIFRSGVIINTEATHLAHTFTIGHIKQRSHQCHLQGSEVKFGESARIVTLCVHFRIYFLSVNVRNLDVRKLDRLCVLEEQIRGINTYFISSYETRSACNKTFAFSLDSDTEIFHSRI